jgi:methionyl-tRNA formyltransferase
VSSAADVPSSSDAGRPVATAFFGSGSFAVPVLATLANLPDVHLVGVVSVPDRTAGRAARMTPPAVAALARERGLPLLQPTGLRDAAAIAALADLEAEVAVLADYGRLVPPEVLAIPARGFLNLHPSLLPRHRGATPIQATILAGDDRAGVTLFEMDEGLDTGPIVDQVEWALTGREAAPELEEDAARRAGELLAAALAPWLAGRRPAAPQAQRGATLTHTLTREDGRLDPDRTAAELERQVRAYTPWPGTFVETAAGRVAILGAEVGPSLAGDVQGVLVVDGPGLALTTADGRLRLLDVKPAGGRVMSAPDLRRGRPALVGSAVLSVIPA